MLVAIADGPEHDDVPEPYEHSVQLSGQLLHAWQSLESETWRVWRELDL